ncbi:MAG: hypothetical protein LBQ72_02135 [Flavobacteriales bacterium]|jgi:hypothetical protein|uniref:hypothetical protein n=1 Tax=Blattabacterium sp. (Mastotermes darwiniensis) TaxID=39768 RepID=UPI000231DFCF|nr:hypothetical protein [Blattabacterium sp. (Mastotermes darwiniensis)]AER40487.1 hypothetical protein MADAR_171 [Blattabacterium sp. (Mastotermes darwiniensis) str. MADAR]MDR1804998.1 hypothetical protein [Flavobacteriales bacterium]
MNVSTMRFIIPTICLSLGILFVSCNDDALTFSSNDPTTTNTDTSFASSNPSDKPSNPPVFNPPIPADISPEYLSKRIKEIGERIERLEKESEVHYNEYYDLVSAQKKIMDEVKRRRMVMKSKPYGSAEQFKAQKEFEDHKKYGKEKLKIIKEKNIFLNKLIDSITEAKNEKLALQKMQEELQKNKSTNNNNEQTTKTNN